jgi:hypothetical protein
MDCVGFGHLFAIAVLIAMWIGGEATAMTRLIWTGILNDRAPIGS